MIEINFHENFTKQFKKLPKEIKIKLIFLTKIFEDSPFNPKLHSKRLSGKLGNAYSFRITREYRVMFRFISENEVIFLAVKHRKDIYK